MLLNLRKYIPKGNIALSKYSKSPRDDSDLRDLNVADLGLGRI